jgi:hypothetical protein
MDEETRKKIERRAEEILNEDPEERYQRCRRKAAELIARREILAEIRREQADAN